MIVISEENDLSESTELPTKPLVKVTPQQQKQIKDLVAVAPTAVVITTNEEYTAAGTQLVQIAANITALDAVHDDIAKPLTDAMAGIKSSVTKLKAFFAVPRLKLTTAQATIRGAMSYYLQQEETKRAAAQKLLDDAAAIEKARIKKLADAAAQKAIDDAAAARKAGDAAKATKIEATATVRADLASVKIAALDAPKVAYVAPVAAGVVPRKNWVYEVFDLRQVPEAYLVVTVNDKLVKAAIAAGERTIPGLMIKQDTSIVRTGK